MTIAVDAGRKGKSFRLKQLLSFSSHVGPQGGDAQGALLGPGSLLTWDFPGGSFGGESACNA